MTESPKGKARTGGGITDLAAVATAAMLSATPPDVLDFIVTGAMGDFASLKDVANGALQGAVVSVKRGSAFNRHKRAHSILINCDDKTQFKLSGPQGDSDEIEIPLVGPSLSWTAYEAEDIFFKCDNAGPTRIQVMLG